MRFIKGAIKLGTMLTERGTGIGQEEGLSERRIERRVKSVTTSPVLPYYSSYPVSPVALLIQ